MNLASITSGFREIQDGTQYNHLFPAADNQDKIILKNGEVNQTVELMIKIVQQTLPQTQKLSAQLKKNSAIETCRKVWEFLYHHIQYKLDQKGLEQLRQPARSWADRHSGIDCDCFSIFVSSILSNLMIPHAFRITKYNGKANFQHVYVIIPNGNTNIVIDCVLSKFNYEKPFSEKQDFMIKPMQTDLGGIDIAMLSGIERSFSDVLKDVNTGAHFKEHPCLETAILSYLKDFRALVLAKPKSCPTEPKKTLQMLDYLIAFWNTPKRDMALDIVCKHEEQMNGIAGFGQLGVFKKIKKAIVQNKAAKQTKKATKVQNKTVKKVAKIQKKQVKQDIRIAKKQVKASAKLQRKTLKPSLSPRANKSITESAIFTTHPNVMQRPEIPEAAADNNTALPFPYSSSTTPPASAQSTPSQAPPYRYESEETNFEDYPEDDYAEDSYEEIDSDESIEGLLRKNDQQKQKKASLKLARKQAKTERKTARKDDKARIKALPKKERTKERLKKVGNALIKYNPATLTARGGVLVAMKLNMGKMASKLKWAYATQKDVDEGKLTKAQWEASKKALAKTEGIFLKIGGDKTKLKMAIIYGKGGDGSLKGGELGLVQMGLGSIVATASVAAAIPIIATIVKALKDSGIMKPEDADMAMALINNANTQKELEAGIAQETASEISNAKDGFLQKNKNALLIGGAVIAGGIALYLMKKNKTKSKSSSKTGLAGTNPNAKKPKTILLQ